MEVRYADAWDVVRVIDEKKTNGEKVAVIENYATQVVAYTPVKSIKVPLISLRDDNAPFTNEYLNILMDNNVQHRLGLYWFAAPIQYYIMGNNLVLYLASPNQPDLDKERALWIPTLNDYLLPNGIFQRAGMSHTFIEIMSNGTLEVGEFNPPNVREPHMAMLMAVLANGR